MFDVASAILDALIGGLIIRHRGIGEASLNGRYERTRRLDVRNFCQKVMELLKAILILSSVWGPAIF
jgi:hypothetical protein